MFVSLQVAVHCAIPEIALDVLINCEKMCGFVPLIKYRRSIHCCKVSVESRWEQHFSNVFNTHKTRCLKEGTTPPIRTSGLTGSSTRSTETFGESRS